MPDDYNLKRTRTMSDENNLPNPKIYHTAMPAEPVTAELIYSALMNLTNKVNTMETNLSNISSELKDLGKKLSEVQEDVDSIRSELYAKIETVNERVETVRSVSDSNTDEMRRLQRSKELIMSGIPIFDGEDLQCLFSNICNALGFSKNVTPPAFLRRIGKPANFLSSANTNPTPSTINPAPLQTLAAAQSSTPNSGTKPVNTRSRSTTQTNLKLSSAKPTSLNSAGTNGPILDKNQRLSCPLIIIEFVYQSHRDDFFRKYLSFKGLNLQHIGMSNTARIYVNENLTKDNLAIKKEALKLKRLGVIGAVSSVEGRVFIKKIGSDERFYIRKMSCLPKIPINDENKAKNLD